MFVTAETRGWGQHVSRVQATHARVPEDPQRISTGRWHWHLHLGIGHPYLFDGNLHQPLNLLFSAVFGRCGINPGANVCRSGGTATHRARDAQFGRRGQDCPNARRITTHPRRLPFLLKTQQSNPDVLSTQRRSQFDDPFARLCEALQSSGGVIAAEELAGRLHRLDGQGVGRIARWIVEEKILSIRSNGGYWIPMFQLCPAQHCISPALPDVLAELPIADDAWACVQWFSDTNEALQGARPADLLSTAPQRVREAARLLRFAIDG